MSIENPIKCPNCLKIAFVQVEYVDEERHPILSDFEFKDGTKNVNGSFASCDYCSCYIPFPEIKSQLEHIPF